MVENKEQNEVKNQVESKKYAKTFGAVAIIALIAGGSWYLHKNYDLMSFFKFENKESEVVVRLQNQINALEVKIKSLESAPKSDVSTQDLAMLNDKINLVSKFNQEVLSSKADAATILGLITRVDSLEAITKNLGQVSSQGALVLTAAMLVKDNAYKGNFIYEAEVLKHLAANTTMQKASEEIYQYAATGVLCNKKLIAEFNKLYENMQKQKEEQNSEEEVVKNEPENWKDKITAKLNEMIVIEKHENKAEQQEQTLSAEDDVYKLVNNEHFSLAIEKMKLNDAYNTEEFKVWEGKVFAQQNFEQALNQIRSQTLAFMKAESLQNQ